MVEDFKQLKGDILKGDDQIAMLTQKKYVKASSQSNSNSSWRNHRWCFPPSLLKVPSIDTPFLEVTIPYSFFSKFEIWYFLYKFNM